MQQMWNKSTFVSYVKRIECEQMWESWRAFETLDDDWLRNIWIRVKGLRINDTNNEINIAQVLNVAQSVLRHVWKSNNDGEQK